MRHGDSWIISCRVSTSTQAAFGGPVAWMRTTQPLGELPAPILPPAPSSRSPSTAFACADGQLRLLTNDRNLSPYSQHRNPLYMWDIDADQDFEALRHYTVFDSMAAGMPIRDQSLPVVDQCKIFPHSGGRYQILAHRIRPVSTNNPRKTGLAINEQEKEACGIYYAAIEYAQAYPPQWSFE